MHDRKHCISYGYMLQETMKISMHKGSCKQSGHFVTYSLSDSSSSTLRWFSQLT